MKGNCRLCDVFCELQKSHLLPAALYRKLVASSEGLPNPILMNPQISVSSSRQAVDYLLCSKCEQRFQQHGESWVARNCHQGDRFPLRDALNKATPFCAGPRMAAYETDKVSDLEMKSLIYFAATVFWRASVHTWSLYGQEVHISLGRKYEDEFKNFLLHKSVFPRNAVLIVSVATTDQFARSMAFPRGGRGEGYFEHTFFAPGMVFRLLIGSQIPRQLRILCIANADHHFIFLTDHYDQQVQSAFIQIMKTSRPSKNLRKR